MKIDFSTERCFWACIASRVTGTIRSGDTNDALFSGGEGVTGKQPRNSTLDESEQV